MGEARLASGANAVLRVVLRRRRLGQRWARRAHRLPPAAHRQGVASEVRRLWRKGPPRRQMQIGNGGQNGLTGFGRGYESGRQTPLPASDFPNLLMMSKSQLGIRGSSRRLAASRPPSSRWQEVSAGGSWR